METKNDPLNIPIFGFELIFLKEVRSSKFMDIFKAKHKACASAKSAENLSKTE